MPDPTNPPPRFISSRPTGLEDSETRWPAWKRIAAIVLIALALWIIGGGAAYAIKEFFA